LTEFIVLYQAIVNGGASGLPHQQQMSNICETHVTRFSYIPLKED
jgi:hypothetical protein